MQPDFELTIHPIDLRMHGKTPYGKPLYRVVRADTRTSKVICNGKRHTLPRYVHQPECKGHWILEKWAPAEVIVGMDREQYEAFLATFPNAAAEAYPERGDYELSRIFNEDSGPFCRNIDETALHKQLAFHEWRHANKTQTERAEEDAQQEAKAEAVKDENFDALYEEAREESQCLQA